VKRADQRHLERKFVTFAQLLEARPWLNERWVRKLIYERRIPFYKPGGGKLIFDLEEIDDWVEVTRIEAAS